VMASQTSSIGCPMKRLLSVVSFRSGSKPRRQIGERC
jgi:hypothetical protein